MIAMKKFFLFLMVAATFYACNSTKNSVSSKSDSKHFGAKISANGAVSYDQLLTELDSKDSMKRKVVGKVEGV